MWRTALFSLILYVLLVVLSTTYGQAGITLDVNRCDSALVRATLQDNSTARDDFRLSDLITVDVWNELKRDYAADAVVYGIPLGGSYAEYRKNYEARTRSLNIRFVSDRSRSVARSTLSEAGASAYARCLDTLLMSGDGLFLAIQKETPTEIILLIKLSGPAFLRPISVDWNPKQVGTQKPQNRLNPGINVAKVPRPDKPLTLVMHYPGYDRSVNLMPVEPPLPPYVGPTYILRTLFTCAASNGDGCPQFGEKCITPNQSGNTFDLASVHITEKASHPYWSWVRQKAGSSAQRICFDLHADNTAQMGNTRVNARVTVYEIVPHSNILPKALFPESTDYPRPKPFGNVPALGE